MKTLILIIAICSVIYAGKGAVFNTLNIQKVHNTELNKALAMLDE